MSNIAKIYARQIAEGKKYYSSVKEKYKADVKTCLKDYVLAKTYPDFDEARYEIEVGEKLFPNEDEE